MRANHLAVVTVAAAAVLAAPATAAAASSSESASAASAPAQELKLRKGLTLYIPIQWEVHRFGPDVVQVVTGKCGKPRGWGTPNCDAFYVLGPSLIKRGDEGFRRYTGKSPFYTSSGVLPCPFNQKWGESIGPKVKRGVRQVGKGHKAAHNVWQSRCISLSNGKTKARFTQREWYLPKSKILVVDQWNTPGLAAALRHADWK
ncbi:hypothetical protein OUY22_15620 [Nonomuraea sp. MCN248]|uniref:Uncharacterized protein n=1 Tax=Nonomuraea corallina TaxID=2989783 RepID=A0ABT4SCB5_9ACTN|nr:hypothetical protein [Nonomuraea corallina]MDA0634852.1 hypothetical protein [Nonomuraea corallina]